MTLLARVSKNTGMKTFRCEVRSGSGKWFVASKGWSAVERDAFLSKFPGGRSDVRFVAEVAS